MCCIYTNAALTVGDLTTINLNTECQGITKGRRTGLGVEGTTRPFLVTSKGGS